jgi:hypothetical protein
MIGQKEYFLTIEIRLSVISELILFTSSFLLLLKSVKNAPFISITGSLKGISFNILLIVIMLLNEATVILTFWFKSAITFDFEYKLNSDLEFNSVPSKSVTYSIFFIFFYLSPSIVHIFFRESSSIPKFNRKIYNLSNRGEPITSAEVNCNFFRIIPMALDYGKHEGGSVTVVLKFIKYSLN